MMSHSNYPVHLSQRNGLHMRSPPYSELVPQQNPPFHIADATYVDSQYSPSDISPMNFEGGSPASSASSLSDSDYQRDRSPGAGKRDPSGVARPRNCFMIFRCQYSREHCREGKRVRRPPGSKPEKSLSKRAAEAWHQLSAEEKERFQALAHQEASEHARLHPGYRFRPLRKGSGKMRNSPALSVPTIPAVQKPYPRQVKTEEVKVVVSSRNIVPPQNDSAATKASRHRSSSAPISAEQPEVADVQNVRMLHRRSKSSAEGWGSLSIPESPPSYLEHTESWNQYSTPDPSKPHAVETVDNSDGSQNTAYHPSPISAASSSSLLNWNGEFIGSAPAATPPFYEPASPLRVPASLSGADSGVPFMQFADYTQSIEPGLEHLLYQSPTHLWAHDLPRYPADMPTSHVMGESAMQLYDAGGCLSSDISLGYVHSSDDLNGAIAPGVNIIDYYTHY